jgi:hypothetical protein
LSTVRRNGRDGVADKEHNIRAHIKA